VNLFPQPVLLFDATGLIFRAYYSIPNNLTAPDGTVTNAIHGVLGSIVKIEDEVRPSVTAMIFDAGRRTFRQDEYAAYKANRPEPPDDLRPQFALTIEMARTLGVPTLVEQGVEADDLIASCAMEAVRRGHPVAVLTSDRDLLQILDTDGVTIWFPVKGSRNRMFDKWDRARFEAEYGFPPEDFPDYKALRGDPSDNVPGVAGIGEKTAMKLVGEYGGLEGIYAALENLETGGRAPRPDSEARPENISPRPESGEKPKPSASTLEKFREKLTAAKDEVFLFRRILTVKRDCEMAKSVDWDGNLPLDRGAPAFREFAERLGLKRYVV
jgi:DNA polymerase-1